MTLDAHGYDSEDWVSVDPELDDPKRADVPKDTTPVLAEMAEANIFGSYWAIVVYDKSRWINQSGLELTITPLRWRPLPERLDA
jgi:hypothetical protein